MEKSKVIDKSKEELMLRPIFTQVELKEPFKLEQIMIKPLEAIKVEPGLLLAANIKGILGIREDAAPSILSTIFGCTQCSACKALSR